MFAVEDGGGLDVLDTGVGVLALAGEEVEEEEALHGAVGVVDAVGLDLVEPLVVVVDSGVVSPSVLSLLLSLLSLLSHHTQHSIHHTHNSTLNTSQLITVFTSQHSSH